MMKELKQRKPPPIRLNLGSYNKIIPGYVNVDMLDLPEVDVVHDLTQFPYPFEDNSVSAIHARCILEHLPLETTQPFLEEIHRICKSDATVYIEVPHRERWMDFPDHKRGFSPGFFYTICKKSEVDWSLQGHFDMVSLHITPYGLGHYMPHWFRKRLSHLVNGIAYTIQVNMLVKKHFEIVDE